MGTLIKYVMYLVLAFFIFRFLNRLFAPKPPAQHRTKSDFRHNQKHTDSLDQPKYKIEAESVDYEILEEPRDQNEK